MTHNFKMGLGGLILSMPMLAILATMLWEDLWSFVIGALVSIVFIGGSFGLVVFFCSLEGGWQSRQDEQR